MKNMGHQIIGYILNLDGEAAKGVVKGNTTLNSNQCAILQAYIQFCRQLRIEGIDQGDVDFSVFHGLPQLIQNGRHIFNIWREELGGLTPKLVEIMRLVAEGELVRVPVFVGFHNVGFDGFDSLNTDCGLLRSYNEGLLELIPPEARPSTLSESNHILGFVLESEYPYKVDFNVDGESKNWPPELNQARDHLVNLQENLSLTFAIAIERTPPVGITPAWTLIIDPLSSGTSISWNPRTNSPVPFYLCNVDNQNSIRNWSSMISNIDDSKIRIAIRRVLSSINERMNPIDGFIDSVIAWENLFGGNAELSLRISAAIARLLKDDEESKHALQKKIVDFYNERSKIVHGVKEITHKEAANKRNECLGIALSCLRALYRTKPELIPGPERAKKLILK